MKLAKGQRGMDCEKNKDFYIRTYDVQEQDSEHGKELIGYKYKGSDKGSGAIFKISIVLSLLSSQPRFPFCPRLAIISKLSFLCSTSLPRHPLPSKVPCQPLELLVKLSSFPIPFLSSHTGLGCTFFQSFWGSTLCTGLCFKNFEKRARSIIWSILFILSILFVIVILASLD